MMKYITLLLLVFNIGCDLDSRTDSRSGYEAPQLYDEYASTVSEAPPTIKAPYDLQLQIGKKNNEHSLIVAMNLVEGNQFISPYSSDRFIGRFSISIPNNENLIMDSKFIETPRSVEELDTHPFINGLVNWVRVNTTYKHQLKVITQKDFEVSGMVSFVIEPRCTMEKIPFIISYQSGNLEVRKIDAE